MNSKSTDKIPTPAEEMREAATLLRKTAEGTTSTEGGGWSGYHVEDDGRAAIFGGPLSEGGYRTGVVLEFRDYLDCEECSRPSAADLAWMWIVNPDVAEPLAKLLEAEADRWDTETSVSLVDCANCYSVADCITPHPEARYHSEGCECACQEIAPENENADWRCPCFDNVLAVARAINGTVR